MARRRRQRRWFLEARLLRPCRSLRRNRLPQARLPQAPLQQALPQLPCHHPQRAARSRRLRRCAFIPGCLACPLLPLLENRRLPRECWPRRSWLRRRRAPESKQHPLSLRARRRHQQSRLTKAKLLRLCRWWLRLQFPLRLRLHQECPQQPPPRLPCHYPPQAARSRHLSRCAFTQACLACLSVLLLESRRLPRGCWQRGPLRAQPIRHPQRWLGLARRGRMPGVPDIRRC